MKTTQSDGMSAVENAKRFRLGEIYDYFNQN